jgi:iron complex outermembrane receptor protein
LVSLSVLIGSPSVGAQDAEPQEDILELGELQVVGSRLPGRSAADSPVPVDIIDGESFRNYGVRDLNNLLSATIPSYNVSQHAIGDANALVRPAKLRGLPPDSTLVLINGKRRHRSSAISIFTFGQAQGAHGVDIRSIPSIALKRVEVLRDGAGAQYGSDAVAGVMNFVLRDAPEGGTVEASWGQYYQGDGDSVNTAANIGVPLTDAGFANFSFEFTNSDSTDRSYELDIEKPLRDAGLPVKHRAMVWGAPDVPYDYKFFGNLGLDLGDHHHAYAFGNWAEREILDSWYFRGPHPSAPTGTTGVYLDGERLKVADLTPDGTGNCPTISARDYGQNGLAALAPLEGNPDCYALAQNLSGGFTPRMRGNVRDWGIAFGLRGTLTNGAYSLLNGWNYDMSAVFGQHRTTYFIWNTVNPQLLHLKDAMPTEYFARAYEQRDKIFNLDFSRLFDTGLFYSQLNVAFGLEYREEEYEIESGDKDGWCVDDAGECDGQRKEHGLAAQGFSVGGQAYPAIRPENEVEAERGSFGAYLDLEADVIEQVLFTAAGRFEHHEGIGESLDGKLAARWSLLEDYLALRGSIGTGFRAPTVGQANYRDTTYNFDPETNQLVETPTLPGTHPLAQHKGAKPLTPETSMSFSVGTVLTLDELSVTLDYYNIAVRNRIGLTSAQGITPEDVVTLAAMGVDASRVRSVRFFTNAFETYTQGIDLVATYSLELFGGRTGTTLLTLAGNWNDTNLNLDSINSQVINSVRKVQVEDVEPEFRFSLMADHTWGPWRFLSRLHYYDGFTEPYQDYKLNPPIYARARALLDLEASYMFDFGLIVAAGVDNLFDTYPTKVGRVHRNEYDAGQKYPVVSPYGYNGGFYYFRAGFGWG